MNSYGEVPAINGLRAKYYQAFRKRISAKTGHLLKPDANQKLIAKLRAEIKLLTYKFRAVFDSTNIYFIILDKEMNIVDFNKASSRFLRKFFGEKMIIGDSILSFLHPDSAKTIVDSCDKAFAGEKVSFERKVGHLDVNSSWWSFEFSPAKDLRGNITGLVFNAIDITKRKVFEAKILSQREKLTEISSIQSHQIRGPVCTIMGIMSLIKENDYKTNKEYLLLLETTTNLLDKNIHAIVAIATDD